MQDVFESSLGSGIVATQPKTMRRLIVHFGMHKTGSSSIQINLIRKKLDNQHFCYIDFGSNPAYRIVNAFMSNAAKHHINIKLGLTNDEILLKREQILEKITNQIINSSAHSFIISAESLVTLRKDDLKKFYDFFKKRFNHIEAVGYIRPPKSFMESKFQQIVKTGSVNNLIPENLYPEYRKKLDKFGDVFGWENCKMWKFEPKNFKNNCVTIDFMSRLGIPLDDKDFVRINDGISKNALKLAYAYYKFGPGHGVGQNAVEENKLLRKKLSELPGKKMHFSSSLISPILEKKHQDIEWMEEKLGVSLQENLSKYDDDAISSEVDLLHCDPESTYWLAEQLGDEYEKNWHPDMTPQKIAEWMHELRTKISKPNNEDIKKTNYREITHGVTT